MPELDRMTIIFRQAPEKLFETRGVLFQEWRQLPQHRADARLKGFKTAEVSFQSARHAVDFFYVRDEAAAFDGERKSFGRFVPPPSHHRPGRQAIKRGIDFHGWELSDIKLELRFGRNIFRIEILLPFLIRPAAGADVNASHVQLLTREANARRTGARRR